MTDNESGIDYRTLFESALSAHPVALSEVGTARRAAIGRSLEAAVVARRRRRLAARSLLAAAVVAAGLAAVFWRPDGVASGSEPERAQQIAARVESWIVRDDPAILARCAGKPAPLPAEIFVDDRELLRLLRAAGRPTGLCRVGNAVILTEPVTDELASE